MGGNISPSLANIFLCHLEKIWLQDCPPEFKPVLYRRYVDDTFVLFKCHSHVSKFQAYLNNRHSRLKFTCENEHNDSLQFLDVMVRKTGDSFSTRTFRKSCNSGLGTIYHSATNRDYKINLIGCLVDRAYKINSTYLNFTQELGYLKSYFCKNFFPLNLVENTIRKKLDKIYSDPPVISTVEEEKLYVRLPFLSHKTNSSMRREILDLVGRFFPQINVNLIFCNNFSVSSFFNYKDKVSSEVLGDVVYEFKCSHCSASYVGETSRHFYTRVSEHLGISPRTGRPYLNSPNSNIYRHFLETGHSIDRDNFKILKHCENNFELKTMESIFIHAKKPSLNNKESSTPLNIL